MSGNRQGLGRRLRWLALAMFVSTAALSAHEARALFFFYKFTPIADSGGLFFTSVGIFPAINNGGRIAFGGRLVGGVEGVFTRLGTGGINTLADTGLGEFRFFGISHSINTPGTVLFFSQFQPEPAESVLLRGSGNSSTPLIDSGSPFGAFAGFQINDTGTAVFAARRDSGNNVILIKGDGNPAVVAEVGSGFSAVDFAPSINNSGVVAFTATRTDGTRGIFTRNGASGLIATAIDNSGPVAGFAAVDLNDAGTIAFRGTLDSLVQGVFRVSAGVLTPVSNGTEPMTNQISGFSMNNSGRVAYVGTLAPIASTVFLGPGVFKRRVVGFGDVLFGRTVTHASLDRDALNDQGQIAISLVFADGTAMVARVDPLLPPFADLVVASSALQLSTGRGSGAGAGTTIRNPRGRVELSFDVKFLNDAGVLEVQLDNRTLARIRASDVGVPTTRRIPIDVRQRSKKRAQPDQRTLGFVLRGKPGFTVQIDNVVIPGLLSEPMEDETLTGWEIDSSRGGAAMVVDTTRFPVKIGVRPGNYGYGSISLAILSSTGLDAPGEIDQSTIRLAGAPVVVVRDKKREERSCTTSDVNGDDLVDLVCEVQVTTTSVTLTLEATTTSGMPIGGSWSSRQESDAGQQKGPPR